MDRSRLSLWLAVGLWMAAGLMRIGEYTLPGIGNSLCFIGVNLCFAALIFLWALSIRHRVLQAESRKDLLLACGMMLLWLILRACKYRFFIHSDFALQQLWYAYYIPQLLAPAAGMLVALRLGGSRPALWQKALLWGGTLLLIAGILTNHLHHQAFAFDPLSPSWQDQYSHGWLYWVSIFWMIGLVSLSLLIIFRKCSILDSRKNAWIPPALFGLGLILILLQFFHLCDLYQLPELCCLTFAMVWESCLQIGLLPVNTHYRDYFEKSTLSAQITDNQWQVYCRAPSAPSLTKQRMQAALSSPLALTKDTILREAAFPGGHVFWVDDLAELHQLNEALEEVKSQLQEENELTQAENEMKQRQATLLEKNRLYDRMAAMVQPQMDQIHSLLEGLTASSPDYWQKMNQACILGAYIKRRCNLALLSQRSALLPSDELRLSLNESVEYLSAAGISAAMNSHGSDAFPADWLLLGYDFFEAAVEKALPTLSALLINFYCSSGEEMTLRLTMENASGALDESWPPALSLDVPRQLSIFEEDGTLFAILKLGEGGVAQ